MTQLRRAISVAVLGISIAPSSLVLSSPSYAVSAPLPAVRPATPVAPTNPVTPLPPQQLPLGTPTPEGQNSVTEFPLSPGDRVKLFISGVGTEAFNGNYVVSFDGSIDLPLIGALPVVGLGPRQVEKRLNQTLLERRLFRPELLRLSIQVVELAPIQVTVVGATFEPGRIVLNQAANQAQTSESVTSTTGENGTSTTRTMTFPGAYSLTRFLTTALKSAGGVRPNADVSRIQLVRNGQTRTIDFSGVLTDQPIDDIPLVAGDQIIVPDAKRIQPALIRPTEITPTRIGLFVSNLTSPGGSKTLNDVEYGTRLSQALIAAQCVGGTSSNSKRRAVLVRSDTRTGQAVTTQRSVEDLTRKSPTVGTEDPFLMPRDGIACYDSTVTNIGSVLSIIGNFLTPFGIINSIFR